MYIFRLNTYEQHVDMHYFRPNHMHYGPAYEDAYLVRLT